MAAYTVCKLKMSDWRTDTYGRAVRPAREGLKCCCSICRILLLDRIGEYFWRCIAFDQIINTRIFRRLDARIADDIFARIFVMMMVIVRSH